MQRNTFISWRGLLLGGAAAAVSGAAAQLGAG